MKKTFWKRTAQKGMALFVAVVLILSAAACGDSGSGSGSGNSSGNSSESTETDESATTVNENLVTEEEQASVGNYLDNLDLPVWDGSVAESYAGGDGTESDPYQISNGEELALMVQDIKEKNNRYAYYVLTADIQLNDLDGWENWIESPPANEFEGIGKRVNSTGVNGFAGVFDGQQHTIYGMYSQHGMFISLCYGGTIKNLNIDASVVNGSENSDAVGGLVGAIETRTTSSESMYIEYCSFNGIVYGSSSAGGLVGDIDMGDNVSIIFCKSSGSVSGRRAGGIIGTISTVGIGDQLTLRYCENYAEVTGDSSAGGVIGEISLGNGAGITVNVSSCRNTGAITGDYEGGIAGYVDVGAGQYMSIRSCINTGNGGVIDEWYISSDGTLSLSSVYYKKGSSAYDKSTSRPYSETITESGLIALQESDFRHFGLPLCSDAQEALETGDYVKYNGKIYYMGYSGRIFQANYDGTQETEMMTITSSSFFGEDGYLCYKNEDYQLVLYNLETGEVTFLSEDTNEYVIAIEDGYVYYGEYYSMDGDYSTDIVKYCIADGTEDYIEIDGLPEEFSPTYYMTDYGFCTSYYSDESEELVFCFYTSDGELFREIRPSELGENAVITSISGTMVICNGDTVGIYDPEAGEITEQYEVEGANLTYCRTVDDETICAVGDDSTYYLVSREDGNCTVYSYN